MPIQSLTLVLAAADANAPFMEKLMPGAGTDSGKGLMLIIGSQVAAILAYWLSSMLFTGDKATVGRALVNYVAAVGAAIAAALLFSFVAPRVIQTGDPANLVLLGVGLVVVLIAVSVVVTMKIYAVDLLPAIGLIVTTALMGFGFNLAMQIAVLGDEVAIDPAAVRDLLVQPTPAPPPPVDPAVLLDELRKREAELARWNERLVIHFKRMPLDDVQAAATYAREKAEYERELERYRTDAAALRGP